MFNTIVIAERTFENTIFELSLNLAMEFNPIYTDNEASATSIGYRQSTIFELLQPI